MNMKNKLYMVLLAGAGLLSTLSAEAQWTGPKENQKKESKSNTDR